MPKAAETLSSLTRPDALSSTLPQELANAFLLGPNETSYKHQYANMYFVRLAKLRKQVVERAKQQWRSTFSNTIFVSRILDVEKGQRCWIVGTIYKEMPLKDNVLNDLAAEHGIEPPPPRLKFHSEGDQTLLEDESGRIKLGGEALSSAHLVTGLVVAVLGVETSTGEFQVVDICYPGAAPQKPLLETGNGTSMDVDDTGEWIALISGLNIGPPSAASDLRINMFVEYLLGETGDASDQEIASKISRVIISGDSFAPISYSDHDGLVEEPVTVPGEIAPVTAKKAAKKYGYEAVAFSTHPTQSLSGHLTDLSRSMVVHLVPGASDPSGATLPQQPLPRAMFGMAKDYESFRCETNPCWIGAGDCHLLGNGGQPLDDIFRYIRSSDRLGIACETLKWRHMAPTAPDTLWCYPYFTADPFIITSTPHVYFIGNQPRFETTIVEHEEGQRTRVILIPRFSDNGELVLVNPATFAVKCIRMGCQWMD
ncbi:hypothetical protein FRC20_011724 [Serendipita sp. 405]|nr:hypothetical protein FRC15_009456 [Serendipita sp. 397]KAG8870542.1 hypothetical protein FRC20_011724 [Serendipita sp. 405]